MVHHNPAAQQFVREHVLPGLPLPSQWYSAPSPSYYGDDARGNMSYMAGSKVSDMLAGHRLLRPLGAYLESLGINTPMAALLGAGLGGLGGAVGGAMTGRDPLRSGLLGAGVGGGGTALISELMRHFQEQNKQASSLGGADALNVIRAKILGAFDIPVSEKSEMLDRVASLSGHEQSELARTLSTAAGAGVGALLAKILFNAGSGGMLASALLGAGLGHSYMPERSGNFDTFGQRRFVT